MSMLLRRESGPLRLPGVRAADAGTLGAWLSELAGADRLFAADLSQGAWRNHQVASEFLAQLGAPDVDTLLAAPGSSGLAASPSPSRVGRRIDRETAGERAIIEAHALATEVVHALAERASATLCCIVGRHGFGWEPADVWFVRFLAQGSRSTKHRLSLVTIGPEEPELPSDWVVSWSKRGEHATDAAPSPPPSLAALVPGILTPQLVDDLNTGELPEPLVPLPGGCALVPPAWRTELRTVPDDRLSRLARAAEAVPWVAAFASYHQREEVSSTSLLWEQARRDHDAGARGIPLRLLERASTRARSPMERAVVTLLAQSVRIVGKEFESAAAIEDPAESLPPELRGWLWHTKGWALTMLARTDQAEACLSVARELLGANPDTDEYLYVLNISALNRLKAGDWEGAHAIERGIQAAIDSVSAGRPQLRYINSLNLARLQQRRGAWKECEAYYREAFETTRGLRSESDALYLNVCFAKLHEAMDDPVRASLAWTRAALHWLSSTVPEAIGPRVVAAIAAADPVRCSGDPLDSVPTVLAARILPRAGSATDACSPPSFVGGDWCTPALAADGTWKALSLARVWVLGGAVEAAPTIESEASRRLRSVLWTLVEVQERSGVRTVVVDDRLGHGLPRSEAEVLGVALRLGIRSLRLKERVLELDGRTRDDLEALLRVRVGSAVAHVSHEDAHATVRFRRYREPRRVGRESSELLRELAGREVTVAALDAQFSLLRELERERIVELFLPDPLPNGVLVSSAADATRDVDQ